ncbi:MAG: sigma-70 family RNA polymerase sigma factor [Erysipelotrichaceae bacterium]|nr:sigma-70 family RNA polymerase sigma factor [Erysipelotrichaceae bacterium]
MEDLEIVELYWNRDEAALKETADKYGNYCYSIAFNILCNNEDAQECVNDTYLGAWNAIPPHHPAVLSTFLGKITRRLSLNRRRSDNAKKRGGGEITLSFDELEECIASGKTIDEELAEQELADMISEFLSTLKEEERKVFVCRYWYFESIADIALRFTYTPSKVKMMLKRTRDRLKDYLERRGVLV